MLNRRSKLVLKALRDACIGLAVYSGIAVLALEDRAQAGSAISSLTNLNSESGLVWGHDPSVLTLGVLGLLFAALTAFTVTVWRHFGQNFALNRVRPDPLSSWSPSPKWPHAGQHSYRKKS